MPSLNKPHAEKARHCEAVIGWTLSARADRRERLMAKKIDAGTILIKEGTLLPERFQLESEPYSKGWRLVENLLGPGMDRQLFETGWSLFDIADEVRATAVGSDLEKTTRRAVKKVTTQMKSDRLNCIEITHVARKRFLGLPYLAVSAHPRHVQESMFLFHSTNRVAEWDRAKLAPAST